MRTFLKYLFFLLFLAFVVIQFFRPLKNQSVGIAANDISRLYPVPANVQSILATSCTDCHSNNTTYPWYAKVQPMAWWLDDHIREGKKELNFSAFGSYSLRKQYHKLEEIAEQVQDDEMPLPSYLIAHRSAKLTLDQKIILAAWVEATRNAMRNRYPIDSLVRKK